jgi:hypothetical protein
MAKPIFSSLREDSILTQFSRNIKNENYVWSKVFPVLPVKLVTAKIAGYGREMLRINVKLVGTEVKSGLVRAIGAASKTLDYTVVQDKRYTCEEHSLKRFVDTQEQDNAADVFDPYRDSVSAINENMDVNNEYAAMLALTSLATVTALTGDDKWSAYSTSQPLQDIATLSSTVKAGCGRKPNTVIVANNVFNVLRFHPVIRDQVKYVGTATLTNDQTIEAIKALCDVKEVIIGDAVYADEDAADALKEIWDGVFIMFYKGPVQLNSQTLGITFQNKAAVVKGWMNEDPEGEFVKVSESHDMLIIDSACAAGLKSVL